MAIAHIERVEGRPPLLHSCRFQSYEQTEDPGAGIASLVHDQGLANAQCVSVMEPGAHALLLIDAPDVLPAELKAAVRWRIKDLIDFHIDDAVIDVFEIPDQRGAGRARLMYAVAARASAIKQIVGTLEATGLELSAIDIPELAIRNVAALLPEDVAGVACVYLSRENGLITLTRQGALYLARHIDLGFQHVNTASKTDASSQAMDAGLQRALDTIILEVQRSLDYYESHFSQPPIGSLVIAPLERDIHGLVAYLSENLGVAVRVLDLNSVVETPEPLPPAVQARCLLAVGAALRQEQKAL